MKTTPKPSQIAILAGAVVLLIFSFLNFVKPSFGDGVSAWSGDFYFPLTIFPLLFGLIVGGTTAATLFADVKLPEQILTLNWKQINFMLSFTGLVILIGLLIGLPDGLDAGAGLLLSLLGAIALFAGSVMELLGIEVGGTTGAGSGPAAPGGPSTPF
ncbi:hypothetical protein KSP35_18915 [Aquihabitans sp. G128]|uniref:hypothetical protein n=1 Tax=Aquihabitans sp. G128 TaxID=2849779 RepID=UPI001C24F8E1|nr:hypothetical protein [Aquihabitans sp. G128]QXC60377.1 hypothetical protein KSP35_18915 [Aquihabitans sp. G128]